MANTGFIMKLSDAAGSDKPIKAMETAMGNSLHNKIRLGRQSPLASRKLQALIALGAVIPLSWLILKVLH